MLTVKDIMHEKLFTIHASDTILKAFKLMQDKEIRHLPVFDADEKLVGILSDKDVLQAMEFNEKGMPSAKVLDFMTWPVESVSDQATVPKVIEKILENKISALLVMNDLGLPTGILTTDDLILSFLDLINKDEINSLGA
jgi:acetoin utilization protein AcuB